MSKLWTVREVTTLRTCFARGDSDAWVARVTGRTARAVALKRRTLGLLVREISSESIRDYATETLAGELRRRGYRVEGPVRAVRPTVAAPAPVPRVAVAVDASRWSVRGSTRVKGAIQRGVTHTVRGDTPNAARRAWAKAVRRAGGDPLLPSASVRLIEATS